MSGDKTCDEEVTQYTGIQSDEGSVVTSWDTVAPEREVHLSSHAQKVSVTQRNICCQVIWGKGGNRARPTSCCAEEEDSHHESSYADATISARL